MVTEAKIEPVKCKPKLEFSPLMSRAAGETSQVETPVVGPTDVLHLETGEFAYKLKHSVVHED